MKTTKGASLLLALLASAWSLHAMATRIDLNPALTNTASGSSFSVDVVISGLTELTPSLALTDFDLDVLYDPSLMNASGVSFGTGLGTPADISDFHLTTAGIVDLFAVSFADYPTLRGFQGDSFTLATLTFLALAPGTGSLSFVHDEFFIVDLISMQNQDPVNGANPEACQSLSCLDAGEARVVIGEGNPVSEPNPLLLLATGSVIMAAARRRRTTFK